MRTQHEIQLLLTGDRTGATRALQDTKREVDGFARDARGRFTSVGSGLGEGIREQFRRDLPSFSGLFGKLGEGLREQFRSIGREAQLVFSSQLTGIISGAAVAAGLKAAFDATDALDASQRRLEATAKLSATSLAFLQQTAAGAQQEFRLFAGVANDLTVGLTRLASKAGQIDQTGAAMRAALDLGAARGLDAQKTLQAVEQAVLGIDEGTDKLFGMNPSALYKEYADQIGKSAGALSDQEKAQAIVNALLVEGGKVAGEYGKFLDDTKGKQQEATKAAADFGVMLGGALRPAREFGLGVARWVLEGARQFVGGVQILAAEIGAFFGSIPSRLRLALANELTELTDWIDAARDVLARIGIDVGAGLSERLRESASTMGDAARQDLEALRQGLEEVKAEIVGVTTASAGAAAAATTTPTKRRTGETDEERAARLKAVAEEVSALAEAHELRVATGAELARAHQLEQELSARLRQGNLALDERVQLAERLRELSQITGTLTPTPIEQTRRTGQLDRLDPETGVFVPPDLEQGKITWPIKLELVSAEPVRDLAETGGEVASVFERIQGAVALVGVELQRSIGDTLHTVVGSALQLVHGLGNAVASMFQAFFEGGRAAGAAFKATMLLAITDVARGLGQMQFAKAAAQIAEAIANPIGAGKALAAAAKHTLAGTMFMALAGASAAGAAGGGGGGGGGGGAAAGGGYTTMRESARDVGRPLTVFLEGDLFLDSSSPASVERWRRFLEEVSGRRVDMVLRPA